MKSLYSTRCICLNPLKYSHMQTIQFWKLFRARPSKLMPQWTSGSGNCSTHQKLSFQKCCIFEYNKNVALERAKGGSLRQIVTTNAKGCTQADVTSSNLLHPTPPAGYANTSGFLTLEYAVNDTHEHWIIQSTCKCNRSHASNIEMHILGLNTSRSNMSFNVGFHIQSSQNTD